MAKREFTRHRLSSLCGDMDSESFNALLQDIGEQGQLELIDVIGDEILDGWHRYRACRLLEIEPKTRDLPEGSDLVAYVLGKNAHRRHMTAEQRAAVVLLAADWMPPHRPSAKANGDTVSPLSNDMAAARAGVSKRTIQRVKAQIRAGHGEALATGSETLRSLAVKARKAASAKAREDAGKAGNEEGQKRSKLVELRKEVTFLKTEIERRDARIGELSMRKVTRFFCPPLALEQWSIRPAKASPPYRRTSGSKLVARGACGLLAAVLAVHTGYAQEIIELPSEDRWLEPQFEELYRVGSLGGEAWEQFGSVHRVAFDGMGQLYVFDQSAMRVFVVGQRGQLLRTLGGPGEGPGEFRFPFGLAVMRDGRLVIADMGHFAYHIFGPDGQFDRRVPMTSESTIVTLTELLPDPGGDAIVTATGSQPLLIRIRDQGQDMLYRSLPIERLSLAGDVITRETIVEGWLPMSETNWLEDRPVFGPRMLAGVLPDGSVAFSDSSAYSIKIARIGAGVWRVLRRPLQPIPVTSRMIAVEKDRQLANIPRTPPGIEELERRRIAGLRFFEEVTLLRNLKTGWDGEIWVQRHGAEPVNDDGPIDVLTMEGHYLGSFRIGAVKMPDAFGPSGLVAFVELGQLDEPMVIVKRLPMQVRSRGGAGVP